MFEVLSIELILSIFSALALFLYGIDHFSKEIQKALGENFRHILSKITAVPLIGAIFGAIVTAVVQSSAATTVITVSLVNAGIISFGQSLGIIIGSNIGTTVTSQLVALNLTAFAPVFIVLGFGIDIFAKKYKFIGKPIFYFGLVFFSLNLLSSSVRPFVQEPEIISLFAELSFIPLAVMVGFIFTVLLQSSSVTSGVIIVLAQSGLISLAQGLPILLGANIGSTTTAIIASRNMDLFAKRTAIAHMFFNIVGVLLIIPFIMPFSEIVISLGGTDAQQIANAHLLFNVFTAIIFLIIIKHWKKAIEIIVPGDEKEIIFKTKFLTQTNPEKTSEAFGLIENEIRNSLEINLESFRTAITSIDISNEEAKNNYYFSKVAKLVSLNEFITKKIQIALFDLSKRKLGEKDAEKLGVYVRALNEIKRIQNWANDVNTISQLSQEKKANIQKSYVLELKEIYSYLDKNIQTISKEFPKINKKSIEEMRKNDAIMRQKLTLAYKNQLVEIAKESESTDGTFLELLSIIESAATRTRELRKMIEQTSSLN